MGSNSIRLVINSIDQNNCYKELYNFKIVARLSSHINSDGELTNKGLRIIIDTLKRFEEIITYHNVNDITGVATAAIRNATNQQQILQTIKDNTPFTFEVLSGYKEAYYGYLAVVNSTNIQTGVTIDIGGGSTEITFFENRKLIEYHSFPFGAITLKQQFISGEQPSVEEIERLRNYLLSQFFTLPWLRECHTPVIGIGGSARNFSLIHQRKVGYPLAGLHQYEIATEEIKLIKEFLQRSSLQQRQNVEGLSKDRADIIIPAIEAIHSLTEVTKSTGFIMSNKGLRDGIFLEKVLNRLKVNYFPNVIEESIYQLTHSYGINLQHVNQIVKLATQIREQLQPFILIDTELEEDLRLLYYSAHLLYIGEFINREASSEHTFYLLTNMTIDGITHAERLAIAFISSFKSRAYLHNYRKLFQNVVTQTEIDKYELLGSILKLAYGFDRSRRNVIRAIKIKRESKKTLQFELEVDEDAYFEIQQSMKYKKHLERSLGWQIELDFANSYTK